jgi:hybrid cluster-associated redox disulfide protein
MVEELITKDTILMEAIEKYPGIAVVLTGYGLHCVGCHFSNMDTIKSGAKIHGLSDEEIEFMLKDVNTTALESLKNKKLNE